jgi:Flp pilus assembly protein TadD
MALAPENPVAASNMAMFLAGHGQAVEAERLLRTAAARPGAPIEVRQNLALVLGLQGRLAEAEKLARQDLPPAIVNNNMAYLRAAGAPDPSRSWDSLRTTP